MSRSPANNEPRLKDVTNSPTRTAGTTPAQQHRPATSNRRVTMPLAEGVSLDLTVIWAFVIALRCGLCRAGRVRPGPGHAVRGRTRGRGPRHHDELGRAGLGRERDLAGPGRGGLFAAFPLAYALILPALYAPIMAMLLALIFRGVAFEFRWRTKRWRKVWDVASSADRRWPRWRRASPWAGCCRASTSTRPRANIPAAGGTG